MKVLLTTLHAKYVHASLALPYLAACCRDLPEIITEIKEFTIHEPHGQILRSIIDAEADVVAFSCYIWNLEPILRLASDLKKVRPQTLIVLGGPEAGYEVCRLLESNPSIEFVVRGEGERSFSELVVALAQYGADPETLMRIGEGVTFRSGDEFIVLPDRPPIADPDTIPSPFAAGLADLSKPLVYYETSRGCPFFCAFCMSSLERGVRSFSLARIEQDLHILMEQQVRTVKLVDRTFNFDSGRANRIWEYILQHNRGSNFHFEIAGDLLTDDNIRLLRRVPEGLFRFEIGVQSENRETLERVGRKSDLPRLFDNVARLREETGVILHLDLVAGLPYEDFPGFLKSLQALFDLRPHHIQVEPLKVLKGSPMRRIAADERYRFSDNPPYQILGTPWLDYVETSRIETIARLIDLYYNSGKFSAILASVASFLPLSEFFTSFAGFWEGRRIAASIPQHGLFDLVDAFLAQVASVDRLEQFRDALRFDYCRAEYPVPGKLPTFFPDRDAPEQVQRERIQTLIRQSEIPAGSRIRSAVGEFLRDYRFSPWKETPVRLLFLYLSAPGRKMEVRVLCAP